MREGGGSEGGKDRGRDGGAEGGGRERGRGERRGEGRERGGGNIIIMVSHFSEIKLWFNSFFDLSSLSNSDMKLICV